MGNRIPLLSETGVREETSQSEPGPLDLADAERPIIGFVGLGHLGICSAVAAAAKGFTVYGIDPEPWGKITEPGLNELVDKCSSLLFTENIRAIGKCNIVYVAADVNDESDMEAVDEFLDLAIKHANDMAIIVILSPVPVGYCRKAQVHWHNLYYQVETLIYGQGIARAMNPPYIAVGSAAPNEPLPIFYSKFLSSFGCSITKMTFESAEICKMSTNCMLMAQICATNALAELCENIDHADWADIAPILQHDKRIGSYLTPGLGVGGGHFTRDLDRAFNLAAETAAKQGAFTTADAWIQSGLRRGTWVDEILYEIFGNDRAAIAIWGLTYKVNTNSTLNSPASRLMNWEQHKYVTHDPVVQPGDPLAILTDTDALTILTPWPQYRQYTADHIAERLRGRVLIDPYRMIDGDKARAVGLDYYGIGICHK